MTAAPVSIHVGQPVQSGLCRLAFEVFTSKPGEGGRTDGVLLGRDHELREFLQDVESNEDPSLERMGYWSVQRRLSTTWDSADDPLLRAGAVYLVVAPGTWQRAEALLWQRPEPHAEPVACRLVFRNETRPARRPVRRAEMEPASRRWPGWAGSISAVSILVLLLWLAPAQLPSAEVVAATAMPRLALDLKSTPAGLELRWHETSAPALLESAVLSVRQDGQDRRIDLSDRFPPDGEYLLGSGTKDKDLVVNLRLRRAGQPLLEQTITYVVPRRKGAERKISVPSIL